jgi:hypothetical protein
MFGLTTDDVAVRIRRCLSARYSALVIWTVSGSGVTVTVVTSGAELTPAVLVATIWNCSTAGAAPAASATVKLTVAPANGFGVNTTGVPEVWVHTKLHVSPRGSRHVAVIDTGVPELTVRGARCTTVGAVEALTVMVTVAVDAPTALLTVSANVSAVGAVMIAAAFGDGLAGAAEASFSMIWGEAVAAYEATLIPDQTPLDRYLAGNTGALTALQQRGLDRFTGKGNCTRCHAGALLSDATVGFFQASGSVNRDGGDQGFHNLGVRPTAEDLGRAGPGPAGIAFSVSGSAFDRGAFKTPGLRNVKLTAPYFHNGGKATLADVVAFYARGGDFANPERARDLQPRSLDAGDQSALVEFLTGGLTDCRVEQQRAPFDHPDLPLPDRSADLPATGAAGLGSCP